MGPKKKENVPVEKQSLKGKQRFFANLNLSPQPTVCLTRLNIPDSKKNNFVINVKSKKFKQLFNSNTNKSKPTLKNSKIANPKIRNNKAKSLGSEYKSPLSKETKSQGHTIFIKSEPIPENDSSLSMDGSSTINDELEGPAQTGDKENDWSLQLSEESTEETANESTEETANESTEETVNDEENPTEIITRADKVIDTFLHVLRKSTDDNSILSALERNYICESCQQGFLNKQCLRKHVLLCLGMKKPKKRKKENNESFSCPMCRKTYGKRESLDKHNASIHNLKRLYKCLVCSQHFYNEEALTLHCRSKHGLGGSNIYKCPYCEASFNLRGDLNYHCRKVHKTTQYYVCEMCLECFKSEETRNLHVQSHGLWCEICMFKTKSESEMEAHKWTHLYVVVHKCEKCARTFKAKRDFTKHIKVHEKERKL